MGNLTKQVLLQDMDEGAEEMDTTVLKFAMGYLYTGELDAKGLNKYTL